MAWDEKNGDSHENDVVCVAFGAALLLSASTVAVNAMGGGSCHLRKTCAVDPNSLCAGVAVGEGRLPTCLKAHMANLSSSCSAKLSREVYVATTCEADVKRFCGNAMSAATASRRACKRISAKSASRARARWCTSTRCPATIRSESRECGGGVGARACRAARKSFPMRTAQFFEGAFEFR